MARRPKSAAGARRQAARSLVRALLPPKRPRPQRRRATAKATSPGARPRRTPRVGRRTTRSGSWLRLQYRGPAGSRPYRVYVPAGLNRNRAAPLLVLLHGCTQDPESFAAATRFNDLADRNGFLVAYPEQVGAFHAHRCWRWYEQGHQYRNLGEPAVIAAITRRILADKSQWRIDATRVYVAGLSAGGAMALIVGATYPDVFAAVGVHSAPPYRSAINGRGALRAMSAEEALPVVARAPVIGGRGMPPTIIFQGSSDRTVNSANGRRVADQWLDYRKGASGVTNVEQIARTATRRGRAGGRNYTLTRWSTAKRMTLLELWMVDDLGHYWSGGADGESYSDPKGPRATAAMWRFFSRHRQPRSRLPGA